MRLRDILTLGLRAQDALKVEEAGETACESWRDDRVGCANSTRCYWVEATGLPNNMMGCFPESNFKDLCEKQWCGHLKPAIPAMVTAGRAVVSRCSKHRNGCSFEEMVPNDDDELFESILALGCKNDHKTELSKEEMSTCKTRLRSAFFYGEQCVHKKQLEPLCLEKNTNYLGGRLQVIALNKDLGEEKGIAECNKSCKDKNENCTMWTYESATGLCALRGSLTEDSHRVMKTVRRGFTSGLLCTPPNPTEEESNLSEVRARRECRQDCTICISCSDEVKEKQEQACALCKNYNVQFGKLQKQNTSGLRKRVRYRRKGVVSKTLSGIIGLTVQSGLDRILTKYVPNDGTKSGLQQCRELCLEHKECQFAKFFDFYCKLFKGVTFSGSMPTLGYESASFWLKYNRVSCGGLIHAALQSSNSSLFEVIDLVVTENPFCANDCQNFFGSGVSMLQTKAGIATDVVDYMLPQIKMYVVNVKEVQPGGFDTKFTVLEIGPDKHYTIAQHNKVVLRTPSTLRAVSLCMYGQGCAQELKPEWPRSGAPTDEEMPGHETALMMDTICTSPQCPAPNALRQFLADALDDEANIDEANIDAYMSSNEHVNTLCSNVGALVAQRAASEDLLVTCTAFPLRRLDLPWFTPVADSSTVMVTSAGCFKRIALTAGLAVGKLKVGVKFNECSNGCDRLNNEETVDLNAAGLARLVKVLVVTKEFAVFTIDRNLTPLDVDLAGTLPDMMRKALKEKRPFPPLSTVHFYRNFKQKISQYWQHWRMNQDAAGHCEARPGQVAPLGDYREYGINCNMPAEAGGGPIFLHPLNVPNSKTKRTVMGMFASRNDETQKNNVVIPIYRVFSQAFVFPERMLNLGLKHYVGWRRGVMGAPIGRYIDCQERGAGYVHGDSEYFDRPISRYVEPNQWEWLPGAFQMPQAQRVAAHIVRNFKPPDSNGVTMGVLELVNSDIERYFTAEGLRKIASIANDDFNRGKVLPRYDFPNGPNGVNFLQPDTQNIITKKECRVCCFKDEDDKDGTIMNCKQCLQIKGTGFYPRLEHESLCKQPTPSPTPRPHQPVPIPIQPPRCKLPKPFQPIPVEVTVFKSKVSVCPLLRNIAHVFVGTATVGGCILVGALGVTECQIAGGGPEEPLSDACAGMVGYFGYTCMQIVKLGTAITALDFLAFAGCEAWCPSPK